RRWPAERLRCPRPWRGVERQEHRLIARWPADKPSNANTLPINDEGSPLFVDGQSYGHAGATFRRGPDGDAAGVGFDDAPRDRQAQAGAFRAPREEGFEGALGVLRADAGTIVVDEDFHRRALARQLTQAHAHLCVGHIVVDEDLARVEDDI